MTHRTVILLLLALALATPAAGGWREHYVVESRLAALRAAPSLTAPLLKRLRTGRRALAVGSRRDAGGRVWLRVAVTRRTRGWILADAMASPGRREDEARLLSIVAGEPGLARADAARVAADRFPRLRAAALAALEDEARRAAASLSRRALSRLGPLSGASDETVRALMLSDPGLDRYNRLGITFDVDVADRRYVPRPVRR